MDVPVCFSRVVASGAFGFSCRPAGDVGDDGKACFPCSSGSSGERDDCCARTEGRAKARAARIPAWGRRKIQRYRRIIIGNYQLICHPLQAPRLKPEVNYALVLRRMCPYRLGLQSRGLGLKDLNLGLRLGLRCLAPLLRFFQLCLQLGVKLVDLFVELGFPVGASQGMLHSQLREVGFYGGDVFFDNRLLHI